MKYEKQPKTVEEHIEVLIKRGLNIPRPARAKIYLRNIGYYRLTGYMYHLQENDGSHEFKAKVSFNDIILHYQFDKKLRALTIEYLERIEVALRARLTDYFAVNYGFFWFNQVDLYDDKDIYRLINTEIAERFENPQELFLKSFKAKYTLESIPPSNMALEVLSLGKLARLYKGLSNNVEKMTIAKDFGLPSSVLSTWFIYLNNVRNICAHHGRLWNRGITADRPTIPTRKQYSFNGNLPNDFNRSFYGVTAMIDRLLLNINPNNRFVENVVNLIDDYASINTRFMGFPDNWRENAAWDRHAL
ncbi:Abi family protein [Aequorivita todarodis]|uniref:Abi family protein n=1 Tax=Aequorivita todarodis TaxID=2036821 RepID=UPI002350ED13|nr:Abi family protein [Aequorivita todarodis]MDC8000114.1 Abi family protein [Aequorivita todarodis]